MLLKVLVSLLCSSVRTLHHPCKVHDEKQDQKEYGQCFINNVKEFDVDIAKVPKLRQKEERPDEGRQIVEVRVNCHRHRQVDQRDDRQHALSSPRDSRLVLLLSVLVSHPLQNDQGHEDKHLCDEADSLRQRKPDRVIPLAVGVILVIACFNIDFWLIRRQPLLLLMVEPNAPSRPLKLREHDVPDEDEILEGLEYSVPLPEHQGALGQLLISSLSDAVVYLGEQMHQRRIAANHVVNIFVRDETGLPLRHFL